MNTKLVATVAFATLGATACASPVADDASSELAQAAEAPAALKTKKECFQKKDPTDDSATYHYCLVRAYRTVKTQVAGGLYTITTDVLDKCEITVRWSKEPPLAYWYTYFTYDCFTPPSSVSGGAISSNIDPPEGQKLEITDFDVIVKDLLNSATDGTATPWDPKNVWSWDIFRWVFDRRLDSKIERVKVEAEK